MKKLIVILGAAALIAGCASHRSNENTGGLGNGTDTDTGTTTNSSYHFDAIPQSSNSAGGVGGSLSGTNSGSLDTNSNSGAIPNNSGTGTPH